MGLPVTDLEASTEFYRTLFGVDPVKERAGYAKFSVADPAVNLSLNHTGAPIAKWDGVSHFGVEVSSSRFVAEARKRLEARGLKTRTEENVTCCYAVSDKVWVMDPDGREWEIYTVLADSEVHSKESPQAKKPERDCCDPTCCQESA